MGIVGDFYSFVVEIEKDGTRTLYGVFTDSKNAEAFALLHKNHAEKVMIRGVFKASMPSTVHPNQTTLEDQINAVHDHIQ
jgi:hypothetical protein